MEQHTTSASDIDTSFIERLHQLVQLAGNASTLAKRAGISHSGLSRYLAGGEPSRKVLVALADATNTSVSWLASGAGKMQLHDQDQDSTLRVLPFISMEAGSEVATTHPQTDFTAQAFCFKWLNKNGLDFSQLCVLEVRGESMEPTLRAGSIVLLDVSQKTIEDDHIYLIRDSGISLIRRLQLEIGGNVRVLADNPKHREFQIHMDQLDILGRLVWCGTLLK
jgi:transcriptional regulator with XRE-family HTH domain